MPPIFWNPFIWSYNFDLPCQEVVNTWQYCTMLPSVSSFRWTKKSASHSLVWIIRSQPFLIGRYHSPAAASGVWGSGKIHCRSQILYRNIRTEGGPTWDGGSISWHRHSSISRTVEDWCRPPQTPARCRMLPLWSYLASNSEHDLASFSLVCSTFYPSWSSAN